MSIGYKTKSLKDVQRENVRKTNQKKGEKKLVVYAVAAIVLIIAIIWLLSEFTKQTYMLKVGTYKIGYVDSRKTAMALVEKAKKQIENEIGTEIVVAEKPSADPANVANKPDSEEKIVASLKEKLTYNVKAYTIQIGDKKIATLPSANAVNNVLNEIKNQFDTTKTAVDFVGNKQNLKQWFKEEITIGTEFVNNTKLPETSEVIKQISEQGTQDNTYEIKEGDTLSKIAMQYDNIGVEDLIKLNPELRETALQIGQKIKVGVSKSGLTVITREEKTYEEIIPKKIVEKENNEKYTNQRTVVTEGKDGKKKVTANIIKYNGVEAKKEVISEKVLVDAVDEVVEVGTKKLAARGYTGIFAMPTMGSITARFGEQRDGYNHKGVDIANEHGTPVYAAGSGTVSETGYDAGGYGNYIKIEHSNGFVTLYGHLSKICVTQGKSVDKNDKIGLSGNTGDSTGNHLHFEVMKEGAKLNPLKYVR